MKTYSVTGQFPAAVAHRSVQTVTVQATTWGAAARRGLEVLMDRDGIRGKRHQAIRLTLAIVEVSRADPRDGKGDDQ